VAEEGELAALDAVLRTPAGYLRVLAIEAALAAVLWSWLWRSGKTIEPEPAAPEEIRRFVVFSLWLLLHTVIVFTAGSVFAHQDAAWFASTAEEFSIMPAHRIIFFFNYPAYAIVGGGLYLYARTRLKAFAARSKLAFALTVFAPFTFLPAFHTSMFDQTLELAEFVTVVLYGLAALAWVLFGIGMLIARALRRVASLTS
jgi:methane/ammonia monooxygenase subunit C